MKSINKVKKREQMNRAFASSDGILTNFCANLQSLRASLVSLLTRKSHDEDESTQSLQKLYDSIANASNAVRGKAQRIRSLRLFEVDEFFHQVEVVCNSIRSIIMRKAYDGSSICRALINMDECYYQLYYSVEFTRQKMKGGQDHKLLMQAPHLYFCTSRCETKTVSNFIRKLRLQSHLKEQIEDAWDMESDDFHMNPLLLLHYCKWKETLDLWPFFGRDAHVPSIETDHCSEGEWRRHLSTLLATCVEEETSTGTMKGRDPLLPSLLRAWSDAQRVWACRFYAFATPNRRALLKLRNYAPIVEIGAGTGYWTYQLKQLDKNIEVHAYDQHPPGVGTAQGNNEYHGRTRCWTNVLPGGPDKVALHPNATLFLCYPSPDNEMALKSLRKYTGSRVVYVGEWSGSTGTRNFEQQLMSHFYCAEIIRLPNWTDSCYMMMVWQRKSPDSIRAHATIGTHPLRCSCCGRGDCEVYRCRITYDVYFCSRQCAILGINFHSEMLRVRGIFLSHPALEVFPTMIRSDARKSTLISACKVINDDSTLPEASLVKGNELMQDSISPDVNELSKSQRKNLKKKRKRLMMKQAAEDIFNSSLESDSIKDQHHSIAAGQGKRPRVEESKESDIKATTPLIDLSDRFYRKVSSH